MGIKGVEKQKKAVRIALISHDNRHDIDNGGDYLEDRALSRLDGWQGAW